MKSKSDKIKEIKFQPIIMTSYKLAAQLMAAKEKTQRTSKHSARNIETSYMKLIKYQNYCQMKSTKSQCG